MALPDVIEQAVRTRQLLLCNCRCYSRIIEPHVLAGHGQMLVAYQVSGGSEDSEWRGWKQFRMAEIAGATPLSEHFQRRSLKRVLDPAILASCAEAGALRAFGGGGEARLVRDRLARARALAALAKGLPTLESACTRVGTTRASLQQQFARVRSECTRRTGDFWTRRAAWPPAHFPAHFV